MDAGGNQQGNGVCRILLESEDKLDLITQFSNER